MRNSRKTILLNCVCVALVLLSGVARYAAMGSETFTANCLICVFFTAAAIIWISQLQRRLLQTEVRRNLIAVAVFVVLWMMLRTVKYVFTISDSVAERYCWYLYYLPQTFILIPMLFSVLHIGRPPEDPISRWWKLLYIPAALIVLGILTNDLHQLAFRFPDGAPYSDSDYSHGFFYVASYLWMLIMFTVMIVIVIHRSAVKLNRKKLWMPLAPLAFGIFCFASYFVIQDNGILSIYKVPEIICFVYCAFMECLLLSGLLPSNDSYDTLWDAASIGAGIMDGSGKLRYSAAQHLSVTPEQVRKAEKEPVLLQNGEMLLQSQAISGGFSFWIKDVSELHRLNHKLEKLGDVLTEENAMLAAENKLAEERARVEQQNRLYDEIAKSVRPQLEQISALLDEPPQDEVAFEQTMKFACILNTYVKRRSNLLLLLHQYGRIESGELCLAINESLEYLRLYGIQAHAEHFGACPIAGEKLLLAYATFEEVLEAALPATDAVLLRLSFEGGGLSLRMELNAPSKHFTASTLQNTLAALQCKLEITSEEQTEYVCLVIPGEGALV